jgi:hypothetical protein
MLIGVNFSDNDFWFVFKEALKLMCTTFKNIENKSKEDIVKFLNSKLADIYYKEVPDGSPHIREYLKVNRENIYFNDEVTAFIENTFHNIEFYVVDTNNNKVLTI